MDKLISIDDERLWNILFDEACVEGQQADRIYKALEAIAEPATFDKENVIKYFSIRKHAAEEDAAVYDEVGDTNRAHLKDTIARCEKILGFCKRKPRPL